MENKSARVVEKQFEDELLDGLKKRKMLAQLLKVPESDLIKSENNPLRIDTFKEIPTAQRVMSDIGEAEFLNYGSLPMVRKPMYEALIKTYFGER